MIIKLLVQSIKQNFVCSLSLSSHTALVQIIIALSCSSLLSLLVNKWTKDLLCGCRSLWTILEAEVNKDIGKVNMTEMKDIKSSEWLTLLIHVSGPVGQYMIYHLKESNNVAGKKTHM